MFRDLTYKKKFYAVILLFVILSITAYKRSFKGTIEVVNFYLSSKKGIDDQSNTQQKLKELQQEIVVLDKTIGKDTKTPEMVKNEILDFLSLTNNDVVLFGINKTHTFSDDYFKVYTNSITLKGDFDQLLKTVWDFEKKFDYARIASLKFYLKRKKQYSKKELFNTIIFQNYEKKK